MKKSLTALCIAAILFSGSALQAREHNPGKMWLKMTEGERLLWVWGYTEGQQAILDELGIKVTIHLNWLILLKDASPISKIMTRYYNDPANTYIPLRFMVFTAKVKLEGKPTATIEKSLEIGRQLGMDLRRDLRENRKSR